MGDLELEIQSSVLRIFSENTQLYGTKEAGGILLGGYIPEKKRYVITSCSVPNNQDIREPNFFVRNKVAAQEIINKTWIESDGEINYLGEWHTHAWPFPIPSSVDRELLRLIITDKSNVWNDIFMIIVGVENTLYIGATNINAKGDIVSEIKVRWNE